MKRLFSDLSALSTRTNAAEQRIHDRAVERDGEIASRLDELRPAVAGDESAADEYRKLTLERGKVAHVIGLAKERIQSSHADSPKTGAD